MLERIQRLGTVEKIAVILALPVALLLLLGATIYWLSSVVPPRPKNVATDAVFLWAPGVGFPGDLPRRGSWLNCWVETDGRDHCQLNAIDGGIEYKSAFTPYGNGNLFRPRNSRSTLKRAGATMSGSEVKWSRWCVFVAAKSLYRRRSTTGERTCWMKRSGSPDLARPGIPPRQIL